MKNDVFVFVVIETLNLRVVVMCRHLTTFLFSCNEASQKK